MLELQVRCFSEYWLPIGSDPFPPCLGVWQCMETFWWSQLRDRCGEGCSWHLVGILQQPRDAAVHPTGYRTVPPTTKNYLAQMANNVRLKNSTLNVPSVWYMISIIFDGSQYLCHQAAVWLVNLLMTDGARLLQNIQVFGLLLARYSL